MKNLTLTLVIFFTLQVSVSGQLKKVYPPKTNPDSVITIGGFSLKEYLGQKIEFPQFYDNNLVMGTYVGCIRLSPNEEVINFFTVNPVHEVVDRKIISLVDYLSKDSGLTISPLSDTTDIFFSIQLYNGIKTNSGVVRPFHVDEELRPSFLKIRLGLFSVPVSLERNPSFENFKKDDELVERTNKLFKKGRYTRSINFLDELIRRNPYNPEIVYMRAVAYINLKKPEKACRDYYYLKNFLQSDKYKNLGKCP